MNLKYILLLLSALLILEIKGQKNEKEVKLTGEAEIMLTLDQTPRQVIKTATEQAKVLAMAEEFGETIESEESFIMKSSNNTYNDDYSLTINSLCKGDWLGDTKKPVVETLLKDGDIYYKVKVEGIARKVTMAPIDFKVTTMRCPDVKCRTKDFADQEPLYVLFNSPLAGYLAIYLQRQDDDTLYCLLPYPSNKEKIFRVKEDIDYTLFSYDHAENPDEAEEYVMFADGKSSKLFLHVIFSQTQFVKERDVQNLSALNDEEFTTPSQLWLFDFEKWLRKNRIHDPKMQYETYEIYVSPN